MTRNEAITELKTFIKATNGAYRALMNDPRVAADKTATHTPELYQAWTDAAARECAFREQNDLCDYPTRRRSN